MNKAIVSTPITFIFWSFNDAVLETQHLEFILSMNGL